MKSGIEALIVEDSPSYLLTIEHLIREVAPSLSIVGKTTSLRTALKMINELNPNLLFLDIQFEEEGMTAFDMLSQIDNDILESFRIIFITGHSEASYMSMAFSHGALHFLEKPVDKLKLGEAIERMKRETSAINAGDWLKEIKQLKENPFITNKSGKIIIEGTTHSEIVDVNDIVFLEASGRYTDITLSDGKKFCACRNLGEFENKLDDFRGFFRIHHHTIVNLRFVKRFSRKERIFELYDSFGTFPASKEKFRDFIRHMESNNIML